ncbi:MAG: hypothetical protein R3A51_19965, partial [Nannocystaceae bacterium]
LFAHVPIVTQYAARGELAALVDGYALNRWVGRYLVRRADVSALVVAREGALATLHFLALPLCLSLFAWLRAPDARRRDEARSLWLWFALALLSASVGGRFYKGYFLAVLPPLSLLAAAPWGLLGAAFQVGARRRLWTRVLMTPLVVALAARACMQLHVERTGRARSHDDGARKIGAHVRARTAEGDRVWFWGWHLWGAYAYSGRLSASRIYKSMGLLTPPNDDTWRTPAAKLRLDRDSPALPLLIDDLTARPPRYIVIGSTVPRDEFSELRALLQRAYRRDRSIRVGRVEFWRLRSP